MKEYLASNIKNVIILGHLGSGKTSLAESLIYTAGGIEKKGEVEKRNTVSDYTPEEQARLSSLSTAIVPVEFKNTKINFLDCPGADEFIGDIGHAMRVANRRSREAGHDRNGGDPQRREALRQGRGRARRLVQPARG